MPSTSNHIKPATIAFIGCFHYFFLNKTLICPGEKGVVQLSIFFLPLALPDTGMEHFLV